MARSSASVGAPMRRGPILVALFSEFKVGGGQWMRSAAPLSPMAFVEQALRRRRSHERADGKRAGALAEDGDVAGIAAKLL